MEKEALREVVVSQLHDLSVQESTTPRELSRKINPHIPMAVIISGIRRCGKSTLLKQVMKELKNSYYLNFEDPRLSSFKVFDFQTLEQVFKETIGTCDHYLFDEIQNVPEWERYVRTKLDQKNKIVLTGSNATLMSRELGTKLTGRHLSYELFPFSFKEFLEFKKYKPSLSGFEAYIKEGGFPQYLKFNHLEILQELLSDILTRDIIVRHGIKESEIITQLLLYLITNIGKEFSYNKLAKLFSLGSPNTVIGYLNYFEESYLLFTVPRFDYSFKKQIINPKKVYTIDSKFAEVNTISLSSDNGRILENIVFLHLRRRYKEIFYFKQKNECDFIVKQQAKLKEAIQVCYHITHDNMLRELEGLKEAMKTLKIKEGKIITFNQEDTLDNIKLIPAWRWMLEEI